MGLFDRFRRKSEHETPLTAASKRTVAELEEFFASRDGVEAYVEPPTATYAMTLCLVADDGETIRRAVKDEEQAKRLCREHGVPCYDARIVGYPQRMKDYQRGAPREKISLDDLPPLVTSADDESVPPTESDSRSRSEPEPSAEDDRGEDDRSD